MFKQHVPVAHIHAWLKDEKGVTDISYVMLWRYKGRLEATALDNIVQENASETMQSNWDALTEMRLRGMKQLHNGGSVQPKDLLQAIRLQNDLIAKYGGLPGAKEVTIDAKRRLNVLVDLVLAIVDEGQRMQIAEAIANTPDLMDWVGDGD